MVKARLGLFSGAILVAVGTAFYRDVQYLQAVFLQMLYFLTPILYPASILPAHYQPWLKLNPLYSQVNIFHRILYEGVMPSSVDWFAAWGVALLFLGIGLLVLSWLEDELVFRL